MPQATTRQRPTGFRLPPEVVNIAGTAAAIFAVVATGSGVVALLPDPTMWQTAAAYLAPAALAFAIYWWIAQKL